MSDSTQILWQNEKENAKEKEKANARAFADTLNVINSLILKNKVKTLQASSKFQQLFDLLFYQLLFTDTNKILECHRNNSFWICR